MTEKTRDKIFQDGPLTLKLYDSGEALTLEWLGMSMGRQPGEFLVPVLTSALEEANAVAKRLVIDFRKLEYLNSSTMTPVIRILEHARRNGFSLRILYDKGLKWQALSFTALELFRTQDGRIEVRGA